MSEGRLAGRAALVTGAADGVGRGIAIRFVQEGAAVVVADFDEERGRQVTEALRAMGGRAEFYACDVTIKERVVGAVQACVDHFGSIDILVNNAYRGSSMIRIEQKDDETFETAMKMNLYAAKWTMEAALRLTGRLDEASVAIAAARAEGGSISYDEPIDLGVYDAMLEGVS